MTVADFDGSGLLHCRSCLHLRRPISTKRPEPENSLERPYTGKRLTPEEVPE
ncbi:MULTISPECIES: hypothetical protein [Pseudomonas]|uniref:hypothetical protein n=1 Tax=Pseudomonas TaxID=286 RepID=UPI000A6FCAEB|nr:MULTISPECIES: hypothetical protein [Pseudomonas]